jgi:hypothetical protein
MRRYDFAYRKSYEMLCIVMSFLRQSRLGDEILMQFCEARATV